MQAYGDAEGLCGAGAAALPHRYHSQSHRVVISYHVEKEGFTVIAGFIRKGSSGTLVSIDTEDFHIEGKKGSWLAFDSIIVDGRKFFLMENKDYGKDAAWTVVDADGKLVVDGVHNGFDQSVLQQIKKYLHPPQAISEPEKQEILSGHTFPSEANISSGSHTEKGRWKTGRST